MKLSTLTLLFLFAVCAVSPLKAAAFRRLRQGSEETSPAPYAPKTLTLGIFFAGAADNAMSYEDPGTGIWSGYEVEVLKQLTLVELPDVDDIRMIRLPDYDSRITFLQNDTVDFVMGLFAVTQERLQLVDFVQPYYYSSGATLFVPVDEVCPVESWEELNGTVVAMREGYYAEHLLLDIGMELYYVPTAQAAAEALLAGEVLGVIDTSVFSYSRMGLKPCENLGMLCRVPAGIAVKKGNTQLNQLLSDAMMRLAQGGDDAILLKLEMDTFGAAGYPPNPDIRDLVDNPAGPNFLHPGPVGVLLE